MIEKNILINRNKSILLNNLDSSYIFATAGSSEVGRSDTIQFFHGSEVAYWPNEENHLSSILMAVPNNKGSEVILESTSNGPSGMFYEITQEALKNKSNFEVIFLPWFMHKEYVSYKDIELSNDWKEYGKQFKLSESQIKWAYLTNKSLSFHNDGYDIGPSNKFLQEFPSSINEAFKVSKKNILIPLESLNRIAYKYSYIEENDDTFTDIKNKHIVEKNVEDIILGVDVARGGNDFSWIIDRQGSFLGFNVNHKLDLKDTMELVGWIGKYIEKIKPKAVCIDAGGGGVGVYDRLMELHLDNVISLINFANKADDSRKYLNKRAEIWGRLKDFVDDSENAIINDPILIQQISSVEYTYNSKGQLQLESKEDIKKKIKQSPDGGDACALTFAYTGHNIRNQLHYGNYSSTSYDYNPFNW